MKAAVEVSIAYARASIDSRWLRGLRWSERVFVGGLLFALIFNFPDYPAVSLDPSWRIALARAFFAGRQFGHDVVFTYGPLGFLMGNTYDGTHLDVLIAWQLVKGVVFTAIIMRTADQLPVLARWACFSLLVLFGVYFEDVLYLFIMTLVGLWCARENEAARPWTNLLAGSGLAFLSAIKFTNLILATASVVIIAGLYFQTRRRTEASRLVMGYVGGFLVVWLLAGQSLGHLPEYFLNSSRISRGYQEAMGLPAPAQALGKALAVLVLLALSLGLKLSGNWRRPRIWAEVLLISAYVFLIWKHGFIRADGHLGGFFIGILSLAAVAPVLLGEMARWRPARISLLVLAALISVWGLDDSATVSRSNAWAIFMDRISCNADHLVHWKGFRSGYDEELRRLCAASPLERTRQKVGRASVDVLGYDGGIVDLHGLNYRPRPVLQSYSAYTPELERLNRDYFLSESAPDFVLQKLQTIDGRLTSLDDAVVLRLLPYLYEYVLAEDGFLLWRRRAPAALSAAVPPLLPLLEAEHAPGEILEVARFADKPLWVEIDFRLSWLGRLRAICYQPPFVRLRVTDAVGVTSDYRLPLSQARGGFIVNPIIDDAADYLMFITNEPRRRLQTLAVITALEDRWFFAGSFHFRLSEVPLLRAERSMGLEAHRARFHMFKTLPASQDAFVPFGEAEISGQSVIMAHAPSEIRFELPEHASRVTGSFGFVAGAHSDGGQTDGAIFQVVWTDGRQGKILFSRQLDPVGVPADRGLQPFSVDLSACDPGQLLLVANPGPTGNNSWDWTAWTGIEIQAGPPK